VIRDPFFQQIIEGLKGKLNPDTFELCANDLLRDIYPSLVPVVGGGDAGRDGETADGRMGRILVCTTAKDVIRNLRRSLQSYLRNGNPVTISRNRRASWGFVSFRFTTERQSPFCSTANLGGVKNSLV